MLVEEVYCVGDDDDGKSRCQPQCKTGVGESMDCGECIRRFVGRGGKTVRAESDPREDRDEGELVIEGRVPDPWGARTGAPGYGATILAARLPVVISPPGYSGTRK
jgi:hypothetical protein